MKNPFGLTGKKIMIVGASSETGRSIASVLHQLGASLLLIDTEEELPEELIISTNSKASYINFDIYNTEIISEKVKSIIAEYGVINGFVFCAGKGGVRPLGLTTSSFSSQMMNANFFAFLEFVRCLTQKGRFAHQGSIVAISSVSSIKGLKSKIAYAASKAALDAAVRCMAAELSDKKIRVNSIQKGWVTSDMSKDFIVNNQSLDENNDFKRQLLGAIKPEELANTTAFLLSDATISITGTSLLLDGGYTL